MNMPFKAGEAFKKGDVLVEFDCERQAAEARAAAAAVRVQKKVVESNQELDKFESIGTNELLISVAQLDKVVAESQALDIAMSDCKITAPFSGHVAQQIARDHEVVSVSQPLLKVVDTTELEVDLIMPSSWLNRIKPGEPFALAIDETGARHSATVVRISPSIDPVSKTVRVSGALATPGGKNAKPVLPGMSGTAHFGGATRQRSKS